MNNPQSNLRTLIEIGSKGFFPLFETDFQKEIKQAQSLTPSKTDIKKIKKVIYKIGEYKNLERQKLVIGSLSNVEKCLLIKEFINMVEGYILDEDPSLH